MADFVLGERTECPVCQFGASDPFLGLPFDHGPIARYLRNHYEGRLDPSRLTTRAFELIECPRCTLVYQRWTPDESALWELYGTLQRWDNEEVAQRRGLDVRLRYAYDIERVIRYTDRPPSDVSVLDFGAGTGLWLQVAAALGCRTSAVELNEAASKELRSAGHQIPALEELPQEALDYVETEQVFEHLVDPRAVVTALAHALRPGGILRVSVPNGTGIRARIRAGDWLAPKGSAQSLEPVAPLEHLNCFNHRSLTRLGAEAGLVPFVFPLRCEVHPTARMRYAVSALKHRIRPPRGTLLFFQRPERS